MNHSILEEAIKQSPLIMKFRQETEDNRKLAKPIIEKLRANGFARMSLDKKYQGLEVPPVESLKIYEILASAEPSVAWVVWNCALVTLVARFMNPKLRSEVFSDPNFLFAQSTRPMGIAKADADSFQVNGQWSLVSGCELADWFFLTCQLHDEDGIQLDENEMPKTIFVSVPKSECKIIDTWHSGGLKGTGSHDVELKNITVPKHRTFNFGIVHEIKSPISNMPIFCTLQCIFAALTLGIASSSVDTIIKMAKTNITPGPLPDLRDRMDAQANVSSFTYALEAARNNLYLQVDNLWKKVVNDEEVELKDIGHVYGSSMHAISISTKAVDSMHALGGTRALYTDSPLERYHRDIHAMLRHIVAQQIWSEDTGRLIFDLEPLIPIYAI